MLRVIFVNLVLIAGVFAAFEGALTYLMSRTEPLEMRSANRIAGKLYWKSVNLIQFVPECAQYDPDLFYTLKPGSCTFENRSFSTQVDINSAGLRDDEASLEAPRIVVTGDSHAMGWGLEGSEAFAEQIESKTGIPTLNAAISSYGTAREVGMLERLDLSALDVLVVQFSAENDDFENQTYLDNARSITAGDEAAYQAEAKERTARYYPFKNLVNFTSVLMERFETPEAPPAASAAQAPAGNEVDRFLDVLADAKVGPTPPVLIVLELSLYGRNSQFAEKVSASPKLAPLESKFSRVVVVESQALLGEQDFLFPDGHTNAQGHEKLADAIIAAMGEAGVAVPDS